MYYITSPLYKLETLEVIRWIVEWREKVGVSADSYNQALDILPLMNGYYKFWMN